MAWFGIDYCLERITSVIWVETETRDVSKTSPAQEKIDEPAIKNRSPLFDLHEGFSPVIPVFNVSTY